MRSIGWTAAIAAAWVFVAAGAPAAPATPTAPASAWVEAPMARARLISERPPASGDYFRAGIEIQMDPGWKAYWRVPGDSGIPPRFDWSRSQNAADILVHWPAPEIFEIADENIFAYQGHVILPVSLRANDPAKPVILRLELDYGICADMCVPLHQTFELTAEPTGPEGPGMHSLAIAQFMDKVPRKPDEANDASTLSARLVKSGSEASLEMDLPASLLDEPARIIVEGPKSFYFGNPLRVPAAATRASIAIVNGDPDGLVGHQVILTILVGEKAWELSLPVSER